MSGTIQVRYAGVEQLEATLRATAEDIAALVEPVDAAAQVAWGSAAVDAELHRIAAQAGQALAGLAAALAADATALGSATANYAATDRQVLDVQAGTP
jgi:hypothetical protein